MQDCSHSSICLSWAVLRRASSAPCAMGRIGLVSKAPALVLRRARIASGGATRAAFTSGGTTTLTALGSALCMETETSAAMLLLPLLALPPWFPLLP